MNQVVEKAKAKIVANPWKAAIVSLVLTGGGGGTFAYWEAIHSLIMLPERVDRLERVMKNDIERRVESGEMSIREALDLMFPTADTTYGG